MFLDTGFSKDINWHFPFQFSSFIFFKFSNNSGKHFCLVTQKNTLNEFPDCLCLYLSFFTYPHPVLFKTTFILFFMIWAKMSKYSDAKKQGCSLFWILFLSVKTCPMFYTAQVRTVVTTVALEKWISLDMQLCNMCEYFLSFIISFNERYTYFFTQKQKQCSL